MIQLLGRVGPTHRRSFTGVAPEAVKRTENPSEESLIVDNHHLTTHFGTRGGDRQPPSLGWSMAGN